VKEVKSPALSPQTSQGQGRGTLEFILSKS
jgi:hypothetical protein